MTHLLTGSFGPAGSPGGGSNTFGDPQAITTDPEGNVYVYENKGLTPGTIYKFNAKGEPAEFTSTHTNKIENVGHTGFAAVAELAVSPAGATKGDLYVVDFHESIIHIFSSVTGEKLGELNSEVETKEGHPWGEPCGVAVGANGDVFVGLANGNINRYAPAGAVAVNSDYSSSLLGLVGESCNLAVDGEESEEDVYVATWEKGPITKYTPLEFGVLGAKGEQVDAVGSTLAVDSVIGGLFVDQVDGVSEFQLPGEPPARVGGLGEVGAGTLESSFGIAAVGGAGKETIYVDTENSETAGVVNIYGPAVRIPTPELGSPSRVRAQSVSVHGTVNPEGTVVKACKFEYGLAEGDYTHVVGCSPAPPFEGESPIAVSADLSGLAANTIYHYQLRVEGESASQVNHSVDGSFTTTGPELESVSVSEVKATSAKLEGEIDPAGIETAYHFIYGPVPACANEECVAPVQDGELAGENASIAVSASITGLQAGHTYHYRLVAGNTVEGELQVLESEEHTFTTQRPGSFQLPDNRQWELVSPPDKRGAQAVGLNLNAGPVAAAEGNAIVWPATAPTEAQPEGYGEYLQVLSTRTSAGWVSRDEESPHASATGVGSRLSYLAFTPDLGVGLLQPHGTFDPSLSPEAIEEQTPYVRDFATGLYTPLVTRCPGEGKPCPKIVEEHADVEAGTILASDEQNGECLIVICGPEVEGVTPNLEHVILQGGADALIPGAAANSLYEWSAGKPLALVSELPEHGGPAPGGAELGFKKQVLSHAISDDGNRVFWEAVGGELYVRDMARGETLAVGSAPFEGANAEGSRVFFAGRECEIRLNGAGSALECVPVEPEGNPKGEAWEQFLGSSENGAWMYYEAHHNIYVSDDGGPAVMVAENVSGLGGEREPGWFGGAGQVGEHWRVSPDGQWIVFESTRGLTGYDSRDAVSGQADEEVYLYHVADHKLACVSCNPSGARPLGKDNGLFVGTWGFEKWVSGSVPGWTADEHETSMYQSRFLSDSGRLFFESADGLVPKDVNGEPDVYEFEPVGVGSCTEGTATGSVVFVAGDGGCVGLISSGESVEEASFLDASESGDSVFFLSGPVTAADRDGTPSVWDARVCTEASPCLATGSEPRPACVGESQCNAPQSPQPGVYGASGTASFVGPGNPAVVVTMRTAEEVRLANLKKSLAACRRKRSKGKRVACEKRALKLYGKSKAGAGKQKASKSKKRTDASKRRVVVGHK